MKFEVDPQLVEPIIREQIAAAVLAQLGDPADLIRRLVTKSLTEKVNSNGIVSNSSYENKHDLIEVLAGNTIRAAAKLALEKIVREAAPQIEAEIAAQIKRAPKKTAAAIMAGFMGLAGQPNNYRLSAEFTFRSNND